MTKKPTTNTAQFSPEFLEQFKTKEEFLGFFNSLYKQGVEQLLKAELQDHLGYEKHSKEGYHSGNSRNGSYNRKLHSETVGDIVLKMPRDRNSTFEPKLVTKGQLMSEHLEQCIISLYSKGMTTADIASQLQEMYGVEVSSTTISNITNSITADIEQWQNRGLENVYFTVWLDGIVFKIKKDNKYINQCIHIVIGLKNDGIKEVLGLWINENESASFWLSVLTDLKARGVEDILIACTDNLTGFTQAIKSVYPNTITQLCLVHHIRNCCKFVVWKDRKEFCADMKKIYQATNLTAAEIALKQLDEKWSSKYKYAIQSWYSNWENLISFLDFPLEIRKLIYTTNTIENLNRNIRKMTKNSIQFPNEKAAIKAAYLAICNTEKKWNQKIQNWGLILQQFIIKFEHRTKIIK